MPEVVLDAFGAQRDLELLDRAVVAGLHRDRDASCALPMTMLDGDRATEPITGSTTSFAPQ